MSNYAEIWDNLYKSKGIEMNKVAESIYSGQSTVVALAEVQHVEILRRLKSADTNEMQPNGLNAITKMTKWSQVMDAWENPIYIPEDEAEAFLSAWCRYRSEIEAEWLNSDDEPKRLRKSLRQILTSETLDEAK